MALVTTAWPVNQAGEIVVSSTVGTDTVVVGNLSESFVPVNSDGKVAFAGIGGGGSTGTPTAITASRAAVSGDNGNTLTNNTASTVVLTINTGMPTGYGFAAAQLSALGVVQIVAGAGVTVNGKSGFNKTSAQYEMLALTQVGANAYVISGASA